MAWQDVIKQHINLIDTNKWEEFYKTRDITNWFDVEDYAEATGRMLQQGIDIISHLDYIPESFLPNTYYTNDCWFPNNIKKIENGAYYGCEFCGKLTLKENLILEASAFEGCKINELVIKDTKHINTDTFANATIEILNLPKTVDLFVFALVDKVGKIIYNGSEEQWNRIYEKYKIENETFIQSYADVYEGVKIHFRQIEDKEML